MQNTTITLTGRPPVRIVDAAWPVIARGDDGVTLRQGTPLPPYECAEWQLRVRRHGDGRHIVYARAAAPGTGWPSHGASDWAGGEVVPADGDVVAAIRRVGTDLIAHGGAHGRIVRECIADLPAVTLE